MTKEEIALQLTLARIGKLEKTANTDSWENCKKYNVSVAEETVKLFNTIYEGINITNQQ